MDDDTETQHDSVRRPLATTPPPALLRVFGGSSAGVMVRIKAGDTTIGRCGEPRSDIPIDDGRASRPHARFDFDGLGWCLSDLGSLNGVYVGGRFLKPGCATRLDSGTVIRIGDTLAVFVTDHLEDDDPAGDRDFFGGVSAAARRIRRRVDVLARVTGHVLVLGEPGTGKERVARRIAARANVFVPVNCGELSREFSRSELFGHVARAFSGATLAKEGLIAAAGDGVLFLDEIGEVPLDVQPELLRFLESGTYRPLGSAEPPRTSTVRIVAATNVDLDEAVQRGTFRRDLLGRLRSSNPPLALPPLHARGEDLPGWIETFVHELVPEAPARHCDAGALECLLLAPWPDNLRGLRSAVRGALEEPRVWPLTAARLPDVIQEHRRIQRSLLPPPPHGDRPGLAAAAAPASGSTGGGNPPPAVPAEPPTSEQIDAALRGTGGNMKAVAAQLQINRRSLYRLCVKAGIDPDTYRPGD